MLSGVLLDDTDLAKMITHQVSEIVMDLDIHPRSIRLTGGIDHVGIRDCAERPGGVHYPILHSLVFNGPRYVTE